MKSSDLKNKLENAKVYVAKIGAPQPHLRDGSVGKVVKVDIETEIHHQENSGSTNYWKDDDFDAALMKVIKREFDSLAEKAVALMAAEYAIVRMEEKKSLIAQLAEIDALEREYANP